MALSSEKRNAFSEFISGFIQRIRQSAAFRWLILSCVLLIIGLGTTLYTTTLNVNNTINLTTRAEDIEYNTAISRPILSNYQVQLDPPWTSIRTAISILGSLSLIIVFPQLLVGYIMYLLGLMRENISSCIQHVVIVVAGILLICCPFTSWGTLLANTVATPTPPIVLPTPTPLPNQETYYAYIDVKAPPYLEQGQSQVIELEFSLLDRYVPDAIPVYLEKSSDYTVSVDIQLTSFELALQSKDILENRSIRINETAKWNWVILPKKEVEGRQAIAWTVKIQDGSSPSYTDLSTVHIDLDIKPKLGISSWWVGREWALVSMFSTLTGVVTTIYSFRMKAEEKGIVKKRPTRVTKRTRN